MTTRSPLRLFPGISHHAFQHPADSRALAVLNRVPLLPLATRKLSELTQERVFKLHFISNAVRVGPKQYPKLYRRYQEMAQALDLRELPDLYLNTADEINAFAAGQENYFVVVYTGLADILTEDELLAIIGHELGHIKCDHMLHKNLATLLSFFGSTLLDSLFLGVGQAASIAFQLSLMAWSRKAEFSCDRAALLTTQAPDVVCEALAKLAGYSELFGDKVDIGELRKQARDYEEIGANSILSKILQLNMMLQETHPFPVVRVDELAKWAESEEYERILDGDYRRSDQPVASSPAEIPLPPLETPVGLVCPKCEAAWPQGSSFCGECRTSLRTAALICGACRSGIKSDWTACPDCGNLLKPIDDAGSSVITINL